MSKKWMIVTGVAALVVVALVAAVYLGSPKTSVPAIPSGGAAGNATSPSATGTGTGVSAGQGATATGTASGSSSTATAGGSSSGANANGSASKTTASGTMGNATLAALRAFPPLPDPHLPAVDPSAPAATGETLAPLKTAPPSTTSALKLGTVPDGASYTVVLRPYGIGPSIALGSRLAVRVDSAKPLLGAPVNSQIVNSNVLVLVDTTHGGTITKGGTYTVRVTFRSDGTKLLPIMSYAKASK